MPLRPILFIGIGLFILAMGVRYASGFDSEVTHLYFGRQETITCVDGKPTAGMGMEAETARQNCAQEADTQRGRSPWWIGIGLGVSIYGIMQFKKARTA